MIEVKMSEILSALPILEELSKKTFKGIIAFKIARVIKKLREESEIFNEVRRKAVENFAEKDENGNLIISNDGIIKLQEDKINECNNSILEILNEIIKLEIEKLPLELFEELEFSPEDILKIEFLIQ